jgi:hypothetical protein
MFQNILRSFYDFNFYKNVRNGWTGWALGHTALTFAVIFAIGITFGANLLHTEIVAKRENGRPSVLEEGLRQIASQWPESTVQDDTLTTTVPGAHIIIIDMDMFGESVREELMTIDTSGTTNYANMTTPILINAKEVIVKKDRGAGDNETEIRPLTEFFKDMPQPFVLNAAQMDGYVTLAMEAIAKHIWKFYLLMGAMTWAFMIPLFLFLRILLLIPVAVAGLVLATVMKRELKYDAAIRVIAMALIPLTIIEAFALIAFGSGVSVWIKVLVSLGVLAAILSSETKKA